MIDPWIYGSNIYTYISMINPMLCMSLGGVEFNSIPIKTVSCTYGIAQLFLLEQVINCPRESLQVALVL